MQPRPAAERQNRLSLVPLVRDLDEVAPPLPEAAPSEPKSQMEWDEEFPPRPAQGKVRTLLGHFMRRKKAEAAAAAAASQQVAQQADTSAISTLGHRQPESATEKQRKGGSIRHARQGIESRRKLEASLPSSTSLTSLTKLQLSTVRAYDELMSPRAFAHQRAQQPRRNHTKQSTQETSWPKRLKEKASARSLRSRTSLASLKDSSNNSQGSLSPSSPRSPGQGSSFVGELPPPVPPIPMRFRQGSQETARTGLERTVTMPSPQSQLAPPMSAGSQSTKSSLRGQREQQRPSNEISPLIAHEKRTPTVDSPRTPSSRQLRKAKASASTTTVNTTATTSSRVTPYVEDDPFFDAEAARVRKLVNSEKAEESRQQKIADKAEKKAVRSVSKEYGGRFKWAKMAIDQLVGKYDEHGWLPKKDPKDFDDDDWKFVDDFLNREDTKSLRDKLFKQPEWIEADKARMLKYEEEMRKNPTPEYLAARKAQEDKERKEYGYRKLLGMLTAEELERERLAESPTVGLGISNALEPMTPSTSHTTVSSEGAWFSSRQPRFTHDMFGASPVQRPNHDQTPSRRRSGDNSFESLTRENVEQLTGVFNTESFDPRLSRLGSEEVKEYIKRKSTDRPTPLTPTPQRFHSFTSLDPRQESETSSQLDLSLRAGQSATAPSQAIRKAASAKELNTTYAGIETNEQPGAYRSQRLPTVHTRHALRDSETSNSTSIQGVAKSRLPVLRKAKSSAAPLSKPSDASTTSSVQHQVVDAPRTVTRKPPAKLQKPPKPRKPSTAVKALSEPGRSIAPGFSSALRPSGHVEKPAATPKTAPLIRKPSTSVKQPRSASDSARPLAPATQPEQQPTAIPKVKTAPSVLPQPSQSSRTLQQSAPIPLDTTPTFSRQPAHTSGLSPEFADGTLRIRDREAPSIAPVAPIAPGGLSQAFGIPPAQPLPKSLARLSRIPTFPDASDFFAVVEHQPDPQQDASVSQPHIVTPRDRLVAKQSNIPVAPGSKVASAGHDPISTESFSLEATPAQQFIRGKSRGANDEHVVPREVPAKHALRPQHHQRAQAQPPDHSNSFQTPTRPSQASTTADPNSGSSDANAQSALATAIEVFQDNQTKNKEARKSKDNTEGQAFHRIEDFDALAQVARSYTQPASMGKGAPDTPYPKSPTGRQMPTPAVVSQQFEKYMPTTQRSSASKSLTASKRTTACHQEQQSMPATPSSTDWAHRSISESAPTQSRGNPATPSARAVSLGNARISSSPSYGNSMVFGANKPTRALGSIPDDAENSRSAPLRQGHFDPYTPTRTRILHSDPRSTRSGTNTPTGSRSRLRHMVGNVFNTVPVKQHEFTQDRQQTSPNTRGSDVSFDDVISAWQQSSPVQAQESHDTRAPFQNQEIQTLRSELGLELIREHIPGDAKHPNHHYTWNTKKIMCRRIHNPGIILPSLPSPTPGQPANMADYAAEYFVGSPYTDEPSDPEQCASCHSLCCRFAQLETEAQKPGHPTDLVQINERRRTGEAVASLLVRKPNGIEEWDSFLKCSQCERRFCPDCIVLCAEKMCQEPVCAECEVASELCSIHNIF